MLRFRPILPKPAATEAVVSVCSENAVVPKRRTKRKYVRVRRKSGSTRKRERPCSPEKEEDAAVVTLQLLPEKGETSLSGDSCCKKNVDLNLNVEKIQIMDNQEHLSVKPESRVAATVTVESVRGTCMGEGGGEGVGGLGRTDAEKVKFLERDTCPGFISDGNWKLRWVNDAYKRMVVSEWEKEEPWPEMVVWLKVKDYSVWRCCYSYPSFTCIVRLQYTWRNEKCTKIVPCDVWRLDCGGFVWRLDVKAALSLGL